MATDSESPLLDMTPDGTIRVGSPFRGEPEPAEFVPQVIIREQVVGSPLAYTAIGAVTASALVLFFGLLGAFWYPTGGLLVASLGCVLSVFGLFSKRRYIALGLLVAHLAIFLFSLAGMTA